MSSKEILSDVLRELLETADTGTTRLANLSGVARKTLNNWLHGHVTHPRHWQEIVKVAAALHLDEAKTDRLLLAAGHARIRKLRANASKKDLALLAQIAGAHIHKAAPAPFRVPADLATFVGRANELATLRAALVDQGHAAICGVRGMGGVGKTVLATHLAYQLRDDFPDGVLWARLDVSDTLTVLASFADAFGIDVSQFRDVESRAAAVRGILAGKRVLLILDNAESSAQIRPLLPPSHNSCAVLVTTRHDLPALDGWTQLPLDAFADDSTTALLLFERYLGARRVKDHAHMLREIAALLGQLPLALSIAAGLLQWRLRTESFAGDVQRLIRALLDDLRKEDARLARLHRDDQSVRASFDVSFASLREEQKRFFSQLSVFGGQDFSISAATAVAGVGVDATEQHLTALISRSLVQPGSEGRYLLHPLLRDYARERLAASDSETSKAISRSTQFFSTHLGLHRNAPGTVEPDVSNVMHLLNTALTPANADHALELSQAFYPYIESRGLFTWAKATYTRASQIAESLSDKKALAFSLRALAATVLRLGEFDNVIEISTRGMQIAKELEEHETVVQFMINIGSAHFGRGHYQDALVIGQEALELSRKINNEQLIASRLITVGTAMSNLGNAQKGKEMLLEGKMMAARIGDKASLLVAYNNLSNVELRERRYDAAAALLLEGIDLAREMGQKERLALLLINYGNANSILEYIETGERALTEGLQIALELGMPWMISMANCAWADHHRRSGKLDLAAQSAMEALSAGERINSDQMIANALFALAQIRAAQGQRREAESLGQESMDMFASNQPVRSAEVRNWLETLNK